MNIIALCRFPTRSGERPTMALKKRGVRYVENVEIHHVDTFSPIGLAVCNCAWMCALALFCLLQDSPQLTAQEKAELSYNQKLVATNGRMPGLKLRYHDRQYAFWSWAMHIMAYLRRCARHSISREKIIPIVEPLPIKNN
jgi:glutamate--cysteine ligase